MMPLSMIIALACVLIAFVNGGWRYSARRSAFAQLMSGIVLVLCLAGVGLAVWN